MELILTPEIENAIRRQADTLGTTPEEIALDGLRKLFVPSTRQTEHAPANLVRFGVNTTTEIRLLYLW